MFQKNRKWLIRNNRKTCKSIGEISNFYEEKWIIYLQYANYTNNTRIKRTFLKHIFDSLGCELVRCITLGRLLLNFSSLYDIHASKNCDLLSLWKLETVSQPVKA